MAERLNAINVGYRPLNPADDVAGLAGQRQAVNEFSAASAAAARQVQMLNQQAELALKANQIANQHSQAMVSANNNMAKARMQIELSQSELAHKVSMDNARLRMQEKMVPLEMQKMAIDNEYAVREGEATIASIRSQNAVRGAQLRQFSLEEQDAGALSATQEELSAHLAQGKPLAEFTPSHTFKSLNGQEAYQNLLDGFKLSGGISSRAATAQQQATAAAPLPQGFLDVLDQRADYTTFQGNTVAGGGQYIYRNSDGSLNDLGQDLQRRMIETQSLGLDSEDYADLLDRRNNRGNKNIWSENKNGNIVLTDAGIAEYKARVAGALPDRILTRMTTDAKGAVTSTWETTNVAFRKALAASLSKRVEADRDTGMIPEITREMYMEARKQAVLELGLNAEFATKAQEEEARRQGRPIYTFFDGEFQEHSIGGAKFGDAPATPESQEELVREAEKAQYLGRAMPGDGAVVRTDENEAFDLTDLRKNSEWPGEEYTTVSRTNWGKTAYAHKGSVHAQLVRPKGEKDRGDFSGITKGFGMTPEEADEVVSLNLVHAQEGGAEDRKSITAPSAVKTAVKQLATDATSLRNNLGELVGTEWSRDLDVMAREADEIVSSRLEDAEVYWTETRQGSRVEFVDAKDTLPDPNDIDALGWGAFPDEDAPVVKGGMKMYPVETSTKKVRKMTLKDALELGVDEWEGMTIMLPWQDEKWHGMEPAEHGGHLPVKGRAQKQVPVRLIADRYDIGAIYKTLDELIPAAKKIKKYNKFIR